MTSSEPLDATLASVSDLVIKKTEKARKTLDRRQPVLNGFINFTEVIASGLNDYATFLEEDSEPADPTKIRRHMVDEMTYLLRIRKLLGGYLKYYFTNEMIALILPQAENNQSVIDAYLDECDSIRKSVNETLGNAIRAALDDLSDEHVLSTRRQESRTEALKSLRNCAKEWQILSDELSSTKLIIDQPDSA